MHLDLCMLVLHFKCEAHIMSMLINNSFLGLDAKYCLTERFLCMLVRMHISVKILTYAVT